MMSRYTGRSLVVIVLRLCFVVAVAHAVRDSTLLYCSFTPEGCFFGYVVSTTWREDLFKDRWWLELMMRKIYSEPSFISISWNVDLNFNSLDVFFFLFRWFCREDFFVNLFVLLWWWIDRRKWATALSNFMNIAIFLFYRERSNGGEGFY